MTDIDLEKIVDDDPSSEADAPEDKPVKLSAADKKAVKAIEVAAKKKEAAKVKKAADKVKATEKKASDKVKTDAKALTLVQKGAKVFIDAGKKAMTAVGNGNLLWTVAAFKLRELTKGTGVNFKDEALEHWGVGKNTATKLANAGDMLNSLTDGGGDAEWMAYMPMGNINNLSTISGFSDVKLALGIDTGVIKIDATEAEINDFNRGFDDKGNPVIVIAPPSTPAAEAEDAAAAEGEGEAVSESETPAKLIARLVDSASDLTPANMIKLIVRLSADLSEKRVDDMFDALNKQHSAPESEGDE